ncbi:MAG TPA: hypothetical protein VFH56_14170 [Acidimicrobiales bacterium]|nr:hypothetical protein [Acidimicrobiales bacterium]
MQINDIRPGSTEPWITPERCPHNEVAFAGESLSWCEACGTVLTGGSEALAAKDASLGVGHVWTNVQCPAYRSLNPADCTCN